MEFKAEINNGVCDAVVDGELTIYHVNEFKKQLEKALKKASCIKLNLANVSEIDTSCFQVLMQAENACLENDKELIFTSVSQPIMEVLEIFGLERHFGGFENLASN